MSPSAACYATIHVCQLSHGVHSSGLRAVLAMHLVSLLNESWYALDSYHSMSMQSRRVGSDIPWDLRRSALGPVAEPGIASVVSAASSARMRQKAGPTITEMTIDEGVQQLNLKDSFQHELASGGGADPTLPKEVVIVDLDELS